MRDCKQQAINELKAFKSRKLTTFADVHKTAIKWQGYSDLFALTPVTKKCNTRSMRNGKCCTLHKLLVEVLDLLEKKGQELDYKPSPYADVMTRHWIQLLGIDLKAGNLPGN